MRRVSGRPHQAHTATSSTSPTTDSDSNVHFPYESDVQTSFAVFSDVFTRVESGFNHFRTVTHDHKARLAAIPAADEEVDATRQLLRSLLTRRNMILAPISLLPPEILARVLHLLALEERPCGYKQSLGWIKTTHVGRHWRQVALGDSSLWARISDTWGVDTALISEMLTRARNAPLDLDIDISIMNSLIDPMQFHPHLSHTRALRLHSLEKSDCEGVREIFNREAPALEHFELHTVGYPMTFQDLGGTTPFKGQAPKLRSFCLSQVCVPWTFIPRGQLTQLKIVLKDDMFYEDLPSLGNARHFIDLLVNCPALEILVLELCLPSDLSQSSRGRTVHLPRLSRLCVGDSISGITDMLNMLRIPSVTTLHLCCDVTFGRSNSDDDILSNSDYDILSAVSAQFQTSVSVEFKSLKVTLNHTLDIAASTSLHPSILQSSSEIETDMDGDAEFVLSFAGGTLQVGQSREILERACKMLPISNLEFLSISTLDLDESINWAKLFKCCTNVATIQAIGRGTSDLIRALPPKEGKKHNGSGTSDIPAPGPIIFPKLTSLLLKNLNFTESKSQSGVLYELYKVLANGLQQRISTYNVPIREVRVDHCIISVKRANDLKKLVPNFCWDGKPWLVR